MTLRDGLVTHPSVTQRYGHMVETGRIAHDPAQERIAAALDRLIADISCDIAGPIPSTLRPSTIADPFYGYQASSAKEVAFGSPGSIGVMAVDNLPGELPRDASEDFGDDLLAHVLPQFFNADPGTVLQRATRRRCEKGLMARKYP